MPNLQVRMLVFFSNKSISTSLDLSELVIGLLNLCIELLISCALLEAVNVCKPRRGFFMYFVEHFIGTCLQRQLAFYMWIG